MPECLSAVAYRDFLWDFSVVCLHLPLIIELEKLTVRFDSATSELKTVKADFKTANKIASDTEKLVSNLEGQLKVYKSTGEEIK